MKIKFLRRNTNEYSRLGKNRKKLQKWRAPKGRDNKMRLRRKSYPRTVEVGYKKSNEERNKIQGEEFIVIRNLKELKNQDKNKLIVFGKIGKRKKLEMAKYAKENNLKVKNVNIEKYLSENEKENKEITKKNETKETKSEEKK